MSLDVYLTMPSGGPSEGAPREAIFIREHGQALEISRDEWDERHPGRKPVTSKTWSGGGRVFHANITHNLGDMAEEAGIYQHLWRPEEVGITKARELIQPLTEGLALMEREPDRFKALNPANAWGSYYGFLPWILDYLEACRAWPDADVSVCR